MADDRLSGLEADLEALKTEYERYFLGLEKRIPQQRERVIRAIERFLPGNDAVERFRYQNLVQRLTTYRRYWDRILRAIEDGTYERDRFKADYRAKGKTESAEAPSAATEAQSKLAAAAIGDEAAAFLASLTGGRPPVASPSGGLPAVGLRGRPVGERPSLNTRELVREAITPGDGFAPRSPTGAHPAVRASGGQPPVVMRGGPVAGRVSGGQPAIAPRLSGSQPAIPPRLSGSQPAIEPRLSGGQPAIEPRLSGGQPAIEPRLSGGQPAIEPRLTGGQTPVLPRASLPPLPSRPTGGQPVIAPRPPAEPAVESRASGAQPPIAPRAGAPLIAPRGQPVSRAAAASAPMRGAPIAPNPAPIAPSPAPVAPNAPPPAAPPAPPPAPMRGEPKAPPPATMRGAPKAPPPAPIRGRPIGGGDSSD